jgi:transcriptional regulator with XRE-family HTH domain
MLDANKTCMVPPMETPGQRIARLRKDRGWTPAELGVRMAEAIERPRPYSRQQINNYEDGVSSLRPDAVKALAIVFKRTEAYILYGDSKKPKNLRTDADILYEKYLALSKADRDLVDSIVKRAVQ